MKGFTIWFTGLSGSGKTTISGLVSDEIRNRGIKAGVIDGDMVRDRLGGDLGFTDHDRAIQAERLTFIAELLSKNEVVAVVAAVSPLKRAREEARSKLGDFVEVYLKCTAEVCAGREEKKLYEKAASGEITSLAGVDLEYEEPDAAEVVCDTTELDPEEAAQKIVKKLEMLGMLSVAEVDDGYSDEEEKKVEDRLRNLGYIE